MTSVLLAALLLGMMTACGETADVPKTTEAQGVTQTEAETEEIDPDSLSARKRVSDGVPDLDFGGRDYRNGNGHGFRRRRNGCTVQRKLGLRPSVLL